MDDSNSEVKTDTVQLRRTMKRTKTKLKRSLAKLNSMVEDTPPEDLHLPELEEIMPYLQDVTKTYEDSFSLLIEAEDDPTTAEADEAEADVWDKIAVKAKRQCNLLLSIKKVHYAITTLQLDVGTLNNACMTDPEMGYSNSIALSCIVPRCSRS